MGECKTCAAFMEGASVNRHNMLKMIQDTHNKVASDLERAAQRMDSKMQALKRKSGWVPIEDAQEAKVMKSEDVKPEGIVVKAEPGVAAPAPEKEVQREEEMSKQQLMTLHGLVAKPREFDGKRHPVFCPHCRKCIEGRNRAKIWQHVSGSEHRSRRFKHEPTIPSSARTALDAELDAVTTGVCSGQCQGLNLSGCFGRCTRLGSDLLASWKEYVIYADLFGASTVNGEARHVYQHLVNEDQWVLRHGKCLNSGMICRNASGESVCRSCMGLGSDQKMLSKVCGLVLDLDIARLLYHHMYSSDRVDEFVANLKEKPNYARRCQVSYDKAIDLSLVDLHKMVKKSWQARNRMNTSMEHFFMLTVKPCIDVEPSCGIKELHLQKALDFMSREPGATPKDLEFIKAIMAGKLSRHPALHGLVVAIATKLDHLERGKSTMRNPKRSLDADTVNLRVGIFYFGYLV